MDPNLVYAKTPAGEEAVQQQTRVVQRNLRMVLVQVDGKLTVRELAEKMNNPRLVESALRGLAEGGFIAPADESAAAAGLARRRDRKVEISALSQFSTFGPKSLGQASLPDQDSVASNFSSFGKPLLPGVRTDAGPSTKLEAPAPWARGERRGKRLSTGKWLFGGLLLLVLSAIALALFFPYDRLKPEIAASASRLLRTPVRIGHVDLAFVPRPELQLSDVVLGTASDSRIDRILLSSPESLLGSGSSRIPRVRVIGADFSANSLISLPMFGWPARLVGNELTVGQIELERCVVRARDLALKDISGEMHFRPDGTLEKASFEAAERSLRIDATPTAQGVMLAIEGMAWRPEGTAVSFNAMEARAVWQKDRFFVEKLDTTFLGGILKGNWLLDWSNGLAMAGDGSVSHLDARQVSAAFAPSLQLEGEVAGSFRLRSSGQDWQSLWRHAELGADIDVTRGMLRGIDLGEAAREGVGAVVRGGSTKFDRLSAAITVGPQRLSAQNVRLDAGMVTASGSFGIDRGRDGQVEGDVTVHVQTSVSRLNVPLRISGTLPELTAVGSK